MRIKRTGKNVAAVIVSVAVVVVVVILSGASNWVGSRVEQEFRKNVEWAAKQGAMQGIVVNMVDYQRSVFAATARTEVIFQMPSLEDPSIMESVTVPVVHSIRHGPLPALTAVARIHSEVQLNENNTEYLNEILGGGLLDGKSLPVFDTVIGWAGGVNVSVVLPKLEANIKNIKIQKPQSGSDGEASMDSSLVADIVIEGPFFIKNNEDVINVGRVTFKSNMTLVEEDEGGYIGTTSILLDKLHFQGKGGADAIRNAEFENIRVTTDASMKGEALGREVNVDVDKIVVESGTKDDESVFRVGHAVLKSDVSLSGEKYKVITNITLDRIHFRGRGDTGVVRTVALENFHIMSDASVKNEMLDMDVKFDADRIVVEGAEKETVEGIKLVFLLEKIDVNTFDLDIVMPVMLGSQGEYEQEARMLLLQRKPAFSIKEASARWPEGMVTGSFRIAYAGNADSKNLSQSGLSGNLQLEVPRALVVRHMSSQAFLEITDSLEDGEENEVDVGEEMTEKVGKQMAAMIKEGIFIEKGDVLTVDAHFQNGNLNLNGKPQQIDSLFKLIPPFF